MMQITVRDMDLPPGRPPIYPWRQIKIGDSFFAAGRTPRTMSKVSPHYRPMKFKCRSVSVKGVVGVKVMRIA